MINKLEVGNDNDQLGYTSPAAHVFPFIYIKLKKKVGQGLEKMCISRNRTKISQEASRPIHLSFRI